MEWCNLKSVVFVNIKTYNKYLFELKIIENKCQTNICYFFYLGNLILLYIVNKICHENGIEIDL